MRICLVTPFAWSQPHDVNEHVAGVAGGLRALGHEVTVLAPSTRAADLLAGRRALAARRAGRRDRRRARRSRSRAARRWACRSASARTSRSRSRRASSTSCTASSPGCRRSRTSRCATPTRSRSRRSPRRTGSATRPRARSARSCSARLDALLALSEPAREAAEERFPGDYRLVSPGVDTDALRARPRSGSTIVVELRPNERVVARGVLRALRELPGWEVVLLRTTPLIGRPAIPRDLAARVHVRTARDGAARAALLNERRDLRARRRRPAPRARSRRRPPAARSRSRAASSSQPELAAAAAARLAEDDALPRARGRRGARRGRGADVRRRRRASSRPSTSRSQPRRRAPTRSPTRSPTGRGSSPTCTCTRRGRTTAAIDPAELVDHAEAEGLGAIAVTDHNVFGGALETADHARGRDLIVIPGEEVKTDGQGEVIGLFLEREIPRGMQLRRHGRRDPRAGRPRLRPAPVRPACTRSPTRATLHRHLADIDVLEVYNARLLFEAYNDEALRFARKYDLTMGAGSDAHVLPGRRHGRAADARLPRPGGVPDLAPNGRGPAPARSRSPTSSR